MALELVAAGTVSSSRARAGHPVRMLVAVALLALGLWPTAHAQRSYVLADVHTGKVLEAKNANTRSFPASLTKLMTAYLLLEAVDAGDLDLDNEVTASAYAVSQPPVRLGLTTGSKIRVEQLLLALIVRSANDAAIAAAELVAGSERAFVDRMNKRALDFGMTRTVFRNPTGLPHAEQTTSARDMALMGRAIYFAMPHHYKLFSTRSFSWGGRTFKSHNGFLSYRGADGLKTGFTCASGYNLVASAERDGRRFIGVVLGAETLAQRGAFMSRMMSTAFARAPLLEDGVTLETMPADPEQGDAIALDPGALASSCLVQDASVRPPTGWSIEFALAMDRGEALRAARRFARKHARTLRGGHPLLIPKLARGVIYRVGLTNLKQSAAVATCKRARANGEHCMVLTPEAGKAAARLGALARRGG
ncbi:MAG: D-alanyl-D-alanine carboxypeptidase family protein [Gammaproteobacteria bacterium]